MNGAGMINHGTPFSAPSGENQLARPVRIVAIDFGELASERLRRIVESLSSAVLVAVASGIAGALEAIARYESDLLLFSVQPENSTPFEVLAALPLDEQYFVAFVSTSEHLAFRAYELDAVDYILAPFGPAQIERAVNRVRLRRDAAWALERIETCKRARRDDVAGSAQAVTAFPEFIWVRDNGRAVDRIAIDQIEWVRAEDDYASIRVRGRNYLQRISLSRLSALLDPGVFVRVHRSILVRRSLISRLERRPSSALEVVLSDGTRLPVGRTYASSVLEWRG
jgi:DNA-binding LytR/AlgR family response regulator